MTGTLSQHLPGAARSGLGVLDPRSRERKRNCQESFSVKGFRDDFISTRSGVPTSWK
jgi:hypothetical protein